MRDVTQALTRLGVNIEEFTSSLEGEPFTGVEMFRATARLSVPVGLKLDHLRKALERLAAEIMVDLTVGEGEAGGVSGAPLSPLRGLVRRCHKGRLPPPNASEETMAKFPERVFSGVQPTGNLHLGNYLGAIKRFVEMQKTHPCIYCVVDLHAMTLPHEPEQLARTTREVTAAFLACGIDPKANIVFNQSRVAEHAELAWIFDCVARLGWLNRMTQFKEKAGKDRENARSGFTTIRC